MAKQLRDCPVCKEGFQPRAGYAAQKYCSKPCTMAARALFPRVSADDRFDGKVMMDPNSGCWLWTGCINSEGYGQISWGGSMQYAHRVNFVRNGGEIPDGHELDHLCRLPCCVNPLHLEPVTHRENGLRGISMPAEQARRTHCIRGHPLSGDNLYSHKGKRQCRICSRIRAAKVRANRRG